MYKEQDQSWKLLEKLDPHHVIAQATHHLVLSQGIAFGGAPAATGAEI
jgi:hypothetical protein